jgi:ADP-heptose:LPS heptosyltransferase
MIKNLVILPNNLGDVLMATPAMEGLKAKHPGSATGFLVENGFEAGIENSPFCDEIILFPRKEIRDLCIAGQWKRVEEITKTHVESIAAAHYDTILNLCQHDYISFLIPLMKGKTVYGRQFLKEGNHAIADPWSHYLYAIPFSRSSNGLHAADVYRRIAGVRAHRGGYSLAVADQERNWAKDFLEKKGVLNKKIMVFQPGAALPSKCWPREHFIELGRLLVHRGWQILATGGPTEKKSVMDIASGIGSGCFPIAGETRFRESIALCSFAQGCVCADTALMHVACALNVPTYALFGPTNPVETGPYGNGNWIFSAYCPQRPCFKTNCPANACMRSILPTTVFSCIENQEPGTDPGCDVYRTELENDGDFRLRPISTATHPYFHKINAFFTRKAFEPELTAPVFAGKDNEAVRETMQWLELAERMKNFLENFMRTHSYELIGEFEREKQVLSRFKGIGEFWSALLNLRLNSVPLLNPIEGIKQSIEVCNSTMRQIRKAVTA